MCRRFGTTGQCSNCAVATHIPTLNDHFLFFCFVRLIASRLSLSLYQSLFSTFSTMYASLVAALALAASVSQVTAGPINHVARGYAQDAELLEDYTPYHVRYLALGCSGQHGSEFFEECCHPLLRWQKLSDRPARCTPSASASSSAVLAEPTATPIDEDPIPDYDDCDDVTSTPAAAVASSTKYVAPEPTTTKAPATTKAAEPTTSEKPASTKEPETTSEKPSSTSTKPSATPAPETGSGDDNTGGFATFFSQGGVAGACGKVHDDYDKVVALDYRRYGDLGKQSSDCGRSVTITNTKNGKTVTAVVADACPTCKNSNSLDLSKGAFFDIATEEEGMVPITWHFNN